MFSLSCVRARSAVRLLRAAAPRRRGVAHSPPSPSPSPSASSWRSVLAAAVGSAGVTWFLTRSAAAPPPLPMTTTSDAERDALRPLAHPSLDRQLTLSPGPGELLWGAAGAHLSVVQRVAHASWWWVSRALRTAQLALIFAPAALLSPLLLTPFTSCHSLVYAQFLRSIEWAGATLCKLGQWASHREDMLPSELCELLKRLRMNAPSHSAAVTRSVIEADFCADGRVWPFAEFDAEPVASGTVGQVHRATLAATGAEVAVKVLHPHVAGQLELDISILFSVADALSHLPLLGWLSIPVGVQEFGATLLQQADLTHEADNLRRFGVNFGGRDLAVVFPTVHDDLVSKRVLTMSWEHGGSLGAFIDSASTAAKERIASLGFDVFMSMLIVDNCVHVDGHVGNSIVQPERWRHATAAAAAASSASASAAAAMAATALTKAGALAAGVVGGTVTATAPYTRAAAGESLVVLDAGMVATLSPAGRSHLLSLLVDIVKSDGASAAASCVRLSRNGCPGGAAGERAFRDACERLFDAELVQRRARGEPVQVHLLLLGVMNAVRDSRMVLDSEFATILVAMQTQESVARALQPDIDLIAKLVPFLFAHPQAALEYWLNQRAPPPLSLAATAAPL